MQRVCWRWRAASSLHESFRLATAPLGPRLLAVRRKHAIAASPRSADATGYSREDETRSKPFRIRGLAAVASKRTSHKSASGVASGREEREEGEELMEDGYWKSQKRALKAKFGDEGWNPRKKLSPDTIDGIRNMHASDPQRFSTPVLAEHFMVSPEAIRRILKSKWRPSPEEAEDRRLRWEKRGERIWSNLAEVGVKPPKPWRAMGVGKAEAPGQLPTWKATRKRRAVVRTEEMGDAITARKDIVATRADSTQLSNARKSLSQRIL